MTRPPTALEILELLSTRARYREWLTGGHLEADHGMITDNLARVTAQIEALTHRQVAEALEQLRAQAAPWTAAELEDLRLLAWALGPENDGQLTITSGRALADTLSIAKMVDPAPGRGRLLPELEALMSVSVREWLLIHRALNALLGQAPQALPEPEAPAAAPTAGEEPETLLERILDTLPNCRDFKLTAPDRDGEWTASFMYDHCAFEGQGSSPEAALIEASVERTIADHYYYADGARLSEAQMTDLLNTAYMTHLGHLPGHGYRGSYLKEDVE
ncbi:hypothetical protein CBQ26_00320 [Deinococcus indicus]|uniref:Uncharacterized protein n=1 Tax=Deinococcus indicus TaxID=223556 RepID=A0A246BTB9_9DEIO|nr:hypothetical protein [Deinococcus indicus]OWL98936.1 hypothetical protein CBQ26_00320 [Deinococcus indicus]